MKRIGHLFETVASFGHLLQCHKKARQGTRKTPRVCAFAFRLEEELLSLRGELLSGAYRPRPYRYFQVRDPKRRTIAVADFRDRVVHHAVVGVLEPLYERRFIHDSYATRKGKGAHAAVSRAQGYLRREAWFLKTDIHKYFDSIRHEVLLGQLGRKVKDARLLELVSLILGNGGSGGIGLPIGNLTSQFFANVYLDGFDHWVKEKLKVQGYVRYMDDFVLFAGCKAQLRGYQEEVSGELSASLGLSLKPSATFINHRDNGLSFLGTRIFPGIVRLHPENARRASRKLALRHRALQSGTLSEECYLQSAGSYCAYFGAYGTYALRRDIFGLL